MISGREEPKIRQLISLVLLGSPWTAFIGQLEVIVLERWPSLHNLSLSLSPSLSFIIVFSPCVIRPTGGRSTSLYKSGRISFYL